MPAAKNAESKQGLVVTLVFFILLSIILGVLTYTGYSGQADLEDKLKKANDDKKTIEENRTWYKAQALVYRAYIGHTSTDLAELKERHDGLKGKSLGGQSKDKDEVYKLIDQIENKEQLGWDEQTKKPKTNYLAMIEDLKRQLQENQAKLNDAEQRRNKLSADLKREQNKNKELKDFFDAELVKLNDARKKDAADAQKLTDKQRTDFGDMGKALADKQVEFDQQIKDKDAIIKKKDKEIKSLKDLVSKINAKLAPIDPTEFTRPQGKIVYMDRTGKMPYINLGSADNLRPQLSFSVYAVGTDGKPIMHPVLGTDGRPIVGEDKKPLMEGKATLEVVRVVDKHLAQTRVTNWRDANGDPVAKGDVIMNAAWDPSLKKHVAIVGVIDLTGEGPPERSAEQMKRLLEFKRLLENQDMVVDAYLDLEDLSVKGKGITRQTDFLIHGTEPPAPRGEVRGGKESDRDKLLSAMDKMRKEAAINGVTIIALNKFLTMTGSKIPSLAKGRGDSLGKIHYALPQAGSPVEKNK